MTVPLLDRAGARDRRRGHRAPADRPDQPGRRRRAWAADMDFGIPPVVRDRLTDSAEREDFGYPFRSAQFTCHADQGTDQGCHGRDASARSAIVRQYQTVPLARRWVVGLERRAGADRSGRPSSSANPGRWRLMSSETEIRPFRVDMPDEAIADLRRRIAATRWPTRELVADRSQGVQLATIQELAALLGDRLRLARVRGETERAAAVHDRDRRGGHPLHPREVAARGRVAADHHARLARLGHRDARGRRPAHRPGRARRLRRGRVRPGGAVPARLRLLRRAGRGRLERRPHRREPGRS